MPQDTVTQDVSYPGDHVLVTGFLARPAKGAAPGVIIAHEWWGLNDHIKDIAQRFAREGYAALAPDLYSRQGHKVTKNPDEAGKLMEALKPEHAIADLSAAIAWLNQQPFLRKQQIGIVGFCMGGGFALLMACKHPWLKAAVPFYGPVPPDAELQKLKCPVLYIYGDRDSWIKMDDVKRLHIGLTQFNKPGEVKIYEGKQHAFFNNTRPDVYDAVAADDAWRHVLRFLKEKLHT